MKIHVLGIRNSFGINRIGGTDSIFRRLARVWIQQGHEVTFVHYGYRENRQTRGWFGIQVREFSRMSQVLDYLKTEAEIIVVNTIHRNDRLVFANFRRRWESNKKFYIVYSLFRENPILRHIYFLESIVRPYRHGTLCVSPRLSRTLGRWRLNPHLVWPPVPRNFYCPTERKPPGGRLRVTYIGRTESGKGIEEVAGIFQRLRGDPRFKLEVHGYYFPEDGKAQVWHEWLKDQAWLDYHYQEIQEWSPETESKLAEHLHNSDILLLPYQKLSSSVDTPLLLIEGMAAGCCILTRPLGDIPTVYGPSPLLIHDRDFAATAVRLLQTADQWVEDERDRVRAQVQSLRCDADTVARQVLALMAN